MSMDGSEPSARSPSTQSVKSPFAATFFRDASTRSTRSNSNRSQREAVPDSVAHDGGTAVEGSTASVRQNAANLFSVFRNKARREDSLSERSQGSSDDGSVDGSLHAGVEQIITRGRRESYEEMAASLASSTPQLFLGVEGKAKIVVKIVYPPGAAQPGRSSETKIMSLRALLLDILNEAQRYEDEAARARHAAPPAHPPRTTGAAGSLPTIYESSSPLAKAASLRRHGTLLADDGGPDDAPAASPDAVSTAANVPALRQRDLRRLEATSQAPQSLVGEQDPYALVRRHVVLFSFGELVSAAVQAERLLLIVRHEAEGAEAALEQLERHVVEWIRAPQPFHFHSDLAPLGASSDAAALSAATAPDSARGASVDEAATTRLPFHASPGPSSSAAAHAAVAVAAEVTAARPAAVAAPSWPFSLRAYDALFATMFVLLSRRVAQTAADVSLLCDAIGDHSLLSLPLQEALRLLKTRAAALRQRVTAFVSLLAALSLETGADADADEADRPTGRGEDGSFAFANLAACRAMPSLYSRARPAALATLAATSADLDFLWEGHGDEFRDLLRRVRTLDARLEEVEASVLLRLDISRNELLVASTVLSVVACTIGFAGFITGAFGMNLDNSEELAPVKGLFGGVFGACLLLIVGLTGAILQYFRAKGILPTHTSKRWAQVAQIVHS